MAEWKALLAERDDSEVAQVPSQGIETRQVIRGAVAMDQAPEAIQGAILVDESLNLAPVQQSSLTVAEHDAMLTMATEDLMDLAVTGSTVFCFDNTTETSVAATCDPQTTFLESDITTDTVVTDDSVHSLDKGCQDFLAAALL